MLTLYGSEREQADRRLRRSDHEQRDTVPVSCFHPLARSVQRAATGALLAGALCADPARAADEFWSGAKTAGEETEGAKGEGTNPSAPRAAAGGSGGLSEIEATLAQAWERALLTQRHAFVVSERAELDGGYA